MPPDAVPDDVVTTKTQLNAAVIDWATWASRALLGALAAATVTIGTWAVNMEGRVHDTERFDARIARLEAKEDGYQALATDMAVLKSKLDAQDKQLDHISALLEATK